MKKILNLLLGLTFALFVIPSIASRPVPSTTTASGIAPSLAPMLQKIIPAVVNISVRGEVPITELPKRVRQLSISPKFEDLGSGVIVDAEKGYIVTNAHVVKDALSITVTLRDGRSMPAKIIGADQPSDIALIQVTAKRLQEAKLADSDKLQVGDFVCAIGSPFGLQQTVTSGVVSGLERSNLGIEGLENFIQTDAPINPGNSGGALIDMQGELVGINTAIVAPAPGSAGIGLAITSNMARSVIDQLIKYGKVQRGILGVMVQDITPALVDAMHLGVTQGALVSQVITGAPAANAGLQSRDVIVSIMGKSVHSATQISSAVSLVRVGTEINFQVRRGDKLIDMKAKVVDPEELKKAAQEAPKSLLAGLELKNFNQLVDNQPIKGVEALFVDDTSVAFSCGLRAGDIILSAANTQVTAINELQAIADKHPKQLLLEVKRGLGGNAFIVLEN